MNATKEKVLYEVSTKYHLYFRLYLFFVARDDIKEYFFNKLKYKNLNITNINSK